VALTTIQYDTGRTAWHSQLYSTIQGEPRGTHSYTVRCRENRVALTAIQYDTGRTAWHSQLYSTMQREPRGSHVALTAIQYDAERTAWQSQLYSYAFTRVLSFHIHVNDVCLIFF
jgi:hypothetical protein